MKIALDMRGSQVGYKKHAFRGIGRIIREIAPRLSPLMPETEFILLFDGRYDRGNVEFGGRTSEIIVDQKSPFKRLEIIKNHISLWPLLRKIKPDVTLFFCHEDALLFMPRSVLFVLDLIPERLPDLYNTYKGMKNKIRHVILKRMARQASLLFTISENSRKDIIGLWGVPAEKIKVVYAGIDTRTFFRVSAEESSTIKARYSLPEDYILYVGGIDPRKNAVTLLEAFYLMSRSGGRKLVMAGNIAEQDEYPVIDATIRSRGLENRVKFTGHVSDCDLPALYSGASLTVFPSLYEGFGLPVLESLACGTPVVTSNSSSIPEVAGDLAVFTDVKDAKSLASAMENALNDKALSERVRRVGPERAGIFTWERVAERTVDGLRSVLARNVT